MSKEIKKVYSDNPYVDELVYYALQLGMGTVLKLKFKADENESIDILREAGNYISCLEGTAILATFDYIPMEVLTSTTDANGKSYGAGLPNDIARMINNDPSKVKTLSPETQKKILDAMMIWYPEHYEEKNNYYRMLNGLPPYEDSEKYYLYVDPNDLPSSVNMDLSKPVHELDVATISILENYGIIDAMYDSIENTDSYKKSDFMYLKHLGKKKIPYYISRKAGPFDPIYVTDIDSDSIREMYLDKLANNRTYTMRTVYSEAYRITKGTDEKVDNYYDNVLAIFIVLITIIDVIARVQEFITRKEIFDLRSVQYLFESYGVDFFDEIPLKYQIAMIKNIHTLLKYKSTAKCMVDICSLFGFDNIKVFKYYLLKDRTVDLTTGEYSFTGDDEKDFTLKFIKLPLDESVNDYIRTPSNHIDYDEITEGDATWDGGLDHEEVKKEVLSRAFNIIRTKYISIDTIYDIAKMSTEQTYFFNMLYDNFEAEELLKIRLPFIDGAHQFKLDDVFSMLTALSFYYYNMQDRIMTDQEQVLHVNGFNFRADLAALAADLERNFASQAVKDLLNKFQVPSDQIPSFEQMMAMYVNNMEVRDALIDGMKNADNLRVYLSYWKLYNALMTVELNLDHYKNPETGDFYWIIDGDDKYSTITEYFRHQEPLLYYTLMDILTIEDESERRTRISTVIDNIVTALENTIKNLDKYPSLFHGLPAVSAEAVKQYIAMVINFYKSFKVDFLGLNTVYYFDDDLDGAIKLIDDLRLERYFEKDEVIKLYALIKSLKSNMTYNQKLELVEDIYMDIRTWAMKKYKETIPFDYDNSDITKVISMIKTTLVTIFDKIGMINMSMEKLEFIKLHDVFDSVKLSYIYDTFINFDESVEITRMAEPVLFITEAERQSMTPQVEKIYYITDTEKLWVYYDEWVCINDDASLNYEIETMIPASGSITITDSRISGSSLGTFVPDLSVIDLVDNITVTFTEGSATITADTSYDIPGTLKISQMNIG